MRNLHQLVLRQQKVDREESQDAEDPIKRVRQQLDKVKLFLESSVTYPEIWRCASPALTPTSPAGRVRVYPEESPSGPGYPQVDSGSTRRRVRRARVYPQESPSALGLPAGRFRVY